MLIGNNDLMMDGYMFRVTNQTRILASVISPDDSGPTHDVNQTWCSDLAPARQKYGPFCFVKLIFMLLEVEHSGAR